MASAFFERIWLGKTAFDVLGSVFFVQVGWMGSFTSGDEGLEAMATEAHRTREPVAVQIQQFGSTTKFYGEAWVVNVEKPWADRVLVALTGTGPLRDRP